MVHSGCVKRAGELTKAHRQSIKVGFLISCVDFAVQELLTGRLGVSAVVVFVLVLILTHLIAQTIQRLLVDLVSTDRDVFGARQVYCLP